MVEAALQAQTISIVVPKEKTQNCLYNRIGLYDSRADTLHFGMVRTSLYNQASYVTANPDLYKQLQHVVDACNDSSAGKDELLFHLREFHFSELPGTTYEKGICLLRAALYVRHAKGIYQRLDVLDTLLEVRKTIDVTNALLKAAANTLKVFVTQNLTRKPADTTIYNTADIKYIESREKSRMPLYTNDTLVDGLYTTYHSFAKQIPDRPVEVQMEYDLVRSVRTMDSKGIMNKVGSEAYAFVYKGNAYLITGNSYSLLRKKNNDFYFSDKWKRPPTSRHMSNSVMNYGITGGFFVAKEAGWYEMKIDYLTGFPLRGRLIERS